jgi:DNA processing protein
MNSSERDRLARVYLLQARTPGDPIVAELVDVYGPTGAAELISAASGLDWQHEATTAMDQCRAKGMRIVVPGDSEWPAVLCRARPPLGLWVLGDGHLGRVTQRAAGIVGRTTPTPYGVRIAAELGSQLARAGWTVVTIGRLGIESAALRGALQDETPTTGLLRDAAPPLVLPVGRMLDPQPPVNTHLFRRVAWEGLLAGEHGANKPARHQRRGFRRQIRLLVDVVSSVVAVEPNGQGWDSRTIRTAEEAELPILTVPGPIISPESAFSHELVRTARTRLLSGYDQVLSELDRTSR